jgi:hypothetical protein
VSSRPVLSCARLQRCQRQGQTRYCTFSNSINVVLEVHMSKVSMYAKEHVKTIFYIKYLTQMMAQTKNLNI